MELKTPAEVDIQIAGTRLFDYLRDLLLLSGQNISFDYNYQYLRIQFGNAVVDLTRAMETHLEKGA